MYPLFVAYIKFTLCKHLKSNMSMVFFTNRYKKKIQKSIKKIQKNIKLTGKSNEKFIM